MKKKLLLILSYVLVAVIAAGTAIFCCLGAVNKRSDKLGEVQAVVDRYFIGEADQNAMDDAAAAAMIQALGDRWSYYMTAQQYKDYQQTMSNSYVGVGVTVQQRSDGQGMDVIAVSAGGPAEEAGVLAGDRVVAVGGVSILGVGSGDVTAMIRGEEGTSVVLTLLRGEEELDIPVQRRRLKTVVVKSQMLEGNVGLITIVNFDARSAEESIAAVDQLMEQGARAIVFDVRNNPGGYKSELVKLLDYLLPEGALFRTVDYKGKEEVDRSDANHVEIPMAVLMNLQSYSAAEFFAAALDEYDAAITVGEKTFGKGYFQTAIELSDGSAVNLSIGKYFTPKGNSLVGVGLEPEVPVALDEQQAAMLAAGALAPEEDPQIQAALDALNTGK